MSKHHKPRPNVVEKVAAKQAAPSVQLGDISNVLVAARRGIGSLGGADMVNVAASIANLEAVLAAHQQAAAPPAPPAAPPSPVPESK